MSVSLGQIAEITGGKVKGDPAQTIAGIATLAKAQKHQLSFLSNSKYSKQLQDTNAGAVILNEKDAQTYRGNAIIHKNPYVAFAKVAQHLDTTPKNPSGIHPAAHIDKSAKIGKFSNIAAGAVISRDAEVGEDCDIGANVFIGIGAKIGKGVVIKANASIHHSVVLEDRVVIHSGAVIGGDGFGYANDNGEWIKIPQIGSVVIGEGTEVGNNACIDRGALDDTVIGKNCIIDNIVQIGHNCVIGDHSCVCGMSGIAGSTTLGKYVVLGGHTGVTGHVEISDGAQFTGMTMVTKNITQSGVHSSGIPAMPNRDWQKNTVRLRTIDKLYARVKELEKLLEKQSS